PAQPARAQSAQPDMFDEDQEHVVAGAAPGDISHGGSVDARLPEVGDLAAGKASALCGRHLEVEEAGSGSCQDIAVEVVHQTPPNRSVRMRPAACPMSSIAAATASTNPVGPQM